MRVTPFVLLLALTPALAAQDTTAIKGLAKRDSVSARAIYNASRSSTVRTEATKIMARTDSLYRAMRATPPAPGPVAATVGIHGSGTSVAVGQSMQLLADVRDAGGAPISGAIVTWSAGPLAVADVSGTGLLTGKSAGTAVVTAKSGTVQGTRSFTVTGTATDTTVVTPPPPPPPPSDTGALPPVAGKAVLATLPQASVDITMPTGYTVVNVGASPSALQAAIDAAGCRTELRGAPGFNYGTIIYRQKPCAERLHTIIRTGNGLPLLPRGTRITPALSAQRNQMKIVSNNTGNVPAIYAGAGVHGYYLEDVAVLATGTTPLTALVRLGDGETSLAQVPGDFVFSHAYLSGTPTLALKRDVAANSSSTAIVDSWLGEAHDNNGDSQAIVGWNGPGPFRIENNYLEASHEVIMFGGADPSVPGLVPSDITIRRNHITRPISWKGVWTAKNLLECKNARRMLVEGNVFENNWADGQVGYWFNCKSVNQDGSAPQSTSQDITVRYNLIRNVGAGINFCAACQNTVIPATRFTVYDNITDGVNCGAVTGEGREYQFLGALTNISVTHTTTIRACNVETAISFDGQPPKITGMDFDWNAYDGGLYGVHGGSGGYDWRLWVDEATATWTGNLQYAAGGYLAAGFDAKGYYTGTTVGTDGRKLGANAALVYQKTAGVVVSDPLRGLRPRLTANAQQTGWKPLTKAQQRANTISGGASVR